MPNTPNLSNLDREKAVAALAEANAKRREVREALKRGEISLEDLETAAAIDDAVGKLKVKSVLAHLPGVSAKRAQTILDRLDIDPGKTLKWMISPSGARQWSMIKSELAPRQAPSEYFPYNN